MNHIYYKVETDHSSPFRINAIFKADCLELTVLKDGAAYYLEVPQELLITLGKNQGMNFPEYYSKLKNYFETHPVNIEFLFKDARFSINVLLDNKMRKIYFQASLNLVSYEDTVLNMLDNLNKARITYFESLTEEQNKNIKVTADYDTLNRKLTELAEHRKTEELSLYNKFVSILNEKKRHIQHLNDLLQAFKNGRPTLNPTVEMKRKNSKQKTKGPNKDVKTEPPSSSNVSDDEIENNETDDSNYSTDEEKHCKSPVPGTSKDSSNPVKPFTFPRRTNSETNFKIERLSPKRENQDEQNGELKMKKPKIEKKPSMMDYDTQDLLDDLKEL